jgi:hypothetical protein
VIVGSTHSWHDHGVGYQYYDPVSQGLGAEHLPRTPGGLDSLHTPFPCPETDPEAVDPADLVANELSICLDYVILGPGLWGMGPAPIDRITQPRNMSETAYLMIVSLCQSSVAPL